MYLPHSAEGNAHCRSYSGGVSAIDKVPVLLIICRTLSCSYAL